MPRTCAGCPRPATAKWCTEACRKRNARARQAAGGTVSTLSVQPDAPDGAAISGSCFEAALRELTEAGRQDTTLGRGCLVLAQRIDANIDTGSALAGALKQLEASMESATKGARVQRTALDELRERRDAKRGA